MSKPKHSNNDQQVEALDQLITHQLNGHPASIPEGLPTAKVDLVVQLVSQARAAVPDADFAAALETELLQRQARSVSQQNSNAEAPAAQSAPDRVKDSHAAQASSHSKHLSSFAQRLQSLRISRSTRFFPRVFLAALSIAIATVFVTASTPSLRILALEFIQVFQRTRSDQVGPQNTAEVDPTEPLSEEMIQEAERQVRTTATIREMEDERSFDLKEPTYIPSGFELQEVGSPYPEVVFANYEDSQTKNRFFITQQRLDGGAPVVGPIVLIPSATAHEEYNFSIMWSNQPLFNDDPALAGGSPIGASAKTTPIQIGGAAGEYVEGTWQEVISASGVMQGMQWVEDSSFRQIQWREGEILFQVFSPNAMSQEEIAKIARGLR